MRYDVHVAAHIGGEAIRFEHEQEEPLKVDDAIHVVSMVYRVKSVQPLDPSESDEFDAIVKAEWAMGPAGTGYTG